VKNLYHAAQWCLDEGKAVCNDCDRRRCGKCNKAKMYKDFDPAVWEMADGSAACRCRECTRGERTAGMWTCRNMQCRLQKPVSEFQMVIEKYGKGVKGNSKQCDECVLKNQAAEKEQNRKSAQQVQKKELADTEEGGTDPKSTEHVTKKSGAQKSSAERNKKKA
jgi:hypothetical protein